MIDVDAVRISCGEERTEYKNGAADLPVSTSLLSPMVMVMRS